jgi:hypothetical protein
MAVYAAMPRSQPLPLVNNASLLPSLRTIARCPSPWQDLPLLLQVGRHSLSCTVLALTFACSVCCGVSGVHCQYHRPGNRSYPYTPSKLGRTYWRAFEPWGDDSLRYDWCDYWCWVPRNHLYYVGIWTGGAVTFALSQFS